MKEERINKYLRSILSHSVSSIKNTQRFTVPYILTNQPTETTTNKRTAKIEYTPRYRYKGRWYTYRDSADNPEQTFGIIKIDNILFTGMLEQDSRKSFVGSMSKMVFQNYIHPFILLLDDSMVGWDKIEIIYDCGDCWIVLHGQEFSNHYLSHINSIKLIVLPYKCEFISNNETDASFAYNLAAFTEWLQTTAYTDDDGEFYVDAPTLNSEYKYHNSIINVGGWAYLQMKLYGLGLLSEERADDLRNIKIDRYSYDSFGNLSSSSTVKFNLLDLDVPADDELKTYVYGRDRDELEEHPKLKLGDGYLYILDDDIIVKDVEFSSNNLVWDLSDIHNYLFRENFLVFGNGKFLPDFDILTSVGNVYMLPNPSLMNIHAILIYNKNAEHIITHADKFYQAFITSQSKAYFDALQSAAQSSGESLANDQSEYSIDAITKRKTYSNIDADELTPLETTSNPQDVGKTLILNNDTPEPTPYLVDAVSTDGK